MPTQVFADLLLSLVAGFLVVAFWSRPAKAPMAVSGKINLREKILALAAKLIMAFYIAT